MIKKIFKKTERPFLFVLFGAFAVFALLIIGVLSVNAQDNNLPDIVPGDTVRIGDDESSLYARVLRVGSEFIRVYAHPVVLNFLPEDWHLLTVVVQEGPIDFCWAEIGSSFRTIDPGSGTIISFDYTQERGCILKINLFLPEYGSAELEQLIWHFANQLQLDENAQDIRTTSPEELTGELTYETVQFQPYVFSRVAYGTIFFQSIGGLGAGWNNFAFYCDVDEGCPIDPLMFFTGVGTDPYLPLKPQIQEIQKTNPMWGGLQAVISYSYGYDHVVWALGD